MYWLSRHYAQVDCYTKEVILKSLNQEKIVFYGVRQVIPSCLILAVTAFKLIKGGEDAYLAHVVDTEVTNNTIENIPIVKEFLDVFPHNLPGLPPDRETEFYIELIPGTTPISIPPSRMALLDRQELKNQLQELLDKGYIRPSVSPWGAPVFFVKKKDGTMRLCILVSK